MAPPEPAPDDVVTAAAEVASILKLNRQAVRTGSTKGSFPSFMSVRPVHILAPTSGRSSLPPSSVISSPRRPAIWNGEVPLPRVLL